MREHGQKEEERASNQRKLGSTDPASDSQFELEPVTDTRL